MEQTPTWLLPRTFWSSNQRVITIYIYFFFLIFIIPYDHRFHSYHMLHIQNYKFNCFSLPWVAIMAGIGWHLVLKNSLFDFFYFFFVYNDKIWSSCLGWLIIWSQLVDQFEILIEFPFSIIYDSVYNAQLNSCHFHSS